MPDESKQEKKFELDLDGVGTAEIIIADPDFLKMAITKDNCIAIKIPLNPHISKNGKMFILASTHGWKMLNGKLNGIRLKINANIGYVIPRGLNKGQVKELTE